MDTSSIEKQMTQLIDSGMALLPKLLAALLVLLLFYVASILMKKFIKLAMSRLRLDDNLSLFLSRGAAFILQTIGVITALGTLGVDVSALVAGLGLTGFALGFALKDSISNVLSGVLILIYRPFQKGDYIMIAGLEGEVVTIDLRYTELAGIKEKILIPNSKLFVDPIKIRC